VGCEAGVFNFKHDMFASETGYYTVDGVDGVSPALEMNLGETYTFIQNDVSNWYHPLGFAYYPDGAHEDQPEVENDDGTGNVLTYLINGIEPPLGLDDYEPAFAVARADWKMHSYEINLTINDPNTTEIFYFCHIHNKMSGRIRINNANEPYVPKELYAPYVPDSFDATCGTFETHNFDLNSENYCPNSTFLCGAEDNQFSKCMQAIDCKMNYEMRVTNFEPNPIVTFIHQMIPHHVNAVNMAKILLKTTDMDETNDDELEMKEMLLSIVNGQNEQITYMRKWLNDHNYTTSEASRCDEVHVSSSPSPPDSENSAPMLAASLSFILVVYGCAVLLLE